MHRYKQILSYARPHWPLVLLLFLLTMAAAAASALQPWPFKLLADYVLDQAPLPPALASVFRTFSLRATPQAILCLAALGGLALFALSSLLDAVLTCAWTFTGRRMVYDLAQDLFARLQRRSLLFHSRNSVGDLLSRITGDSWCVYQVIDTLLFAPWHALLITLAMILIMAHMDLQLTFIALAAAPAMAAVSLLAGKPLRAAAKLKREIESGLQSHVQQTLAGIPVVQAFAQEEREHRRFRVQQRTVVIGSLSSLSSGLVTTVGSGLIVWLGAIHVLDHRITVGDLSVFVFYLNNLQNQFKILAGVYTTLQTLSANVDRVNVVLDAKPEVLDRPGAFPLPPTRGQVSIEEVTFGYQPGQPVLRQVSLEARTGQIIAIVGPTGAGKSTLVSLIPRFNDPWEGRVLIDGHDLREVRLETVRKQVALMLQEPFLFPFSIAENIAYGCPAASAPEIEAAARAANAHDFINRLPEGYQTMLGEYGGTISGGERQRLAIARALLKNAPILILDEPTSALDAETESLLLEALERLMKDRTTFIIAHRLSTVRRADCILVLQDGRVVQRGTHDQLLTQGAQYAHLYNLQFVTE
jgi:ATP-binding cassette subfamily B protein/subfamily B ATP-binding cassette protein MsbA